MGCEEPIKKTNYVNSSDVPFTPAVNANSGRVFIQFMESCHGRSR
jgi:hypothetical protein